MIAAILAAALSAPPSVLQNAPGAGVARYVRLNMQVDGYGIRGGATLLVDRRTARYAEHFDIGPQSFYQGFDGARAWQADAAGTTAVEGNTLDRALVRAWGDLFASSNRAAAAGSIAVNPETHRVVRFTMWNGLFKQIAVFGDYGELSGVIAPRTIRFTDDNGTWQARVISVQTPARIASTAFDPPSRNRDASIAGRQTSVPFMLATQIIIPARINNGPVMHFILDTGGQNVLTADSVKRLGLHPIGGGTVGGAGAGVVPTRFLTVRSVRIGSAEMRNQPFIVFDSSVLQGVDGIVGYELLSRFAARIDYRTNTLTLASSVPNAWIAAMQPTPFVFRSRQPQVNGSIDGIPAALTIDTGNSGILDVNAPFAREHKLWAYYHAANPKAGSLAGVGGAVHASPITVRTLRLGSAVLQNVRGDLTEAATGIEADPSFAANAGEDIFRNFTFVLDYAHQQLYFEPGGIRDMSGVLFARRGDRIVVSAVRTNHAKVAGIRVGMTLTSLNGRRVAGDLALVRAQLEDREPGSNATLVFDGSKRVTLPLVDYL